jgi:hypothetical protein
MTKKHKFLSKPLIVIGSALLLPLALATNGFGGGTNHTYTKYLAPPNGFDDTATLQDALDDCVANHKVGCTIHLAIGNYLSKPLEATDFHGALVGKGVDITTISLLTPISTEWRVNTFDISSGTRMTWVTSEF